jgi:dihydropyrimidine dehydrogenase (NAD+) subunit PreA
MLRGYRIVEDMIEGLELHATSKGSPTLDAAGRARGAGLLRVGRARPELRDRRQDRRDKCIGCQLCVTACHDGAHQCIHPNPTGLRVPIVDESECVGCNLCQIVCPVSGCITMEPVDNGYAPATWNLHLTEDAALRPKKGSHSSVAAPW